MRITQEQIASLMALIAAAFPQGTSTVVILRTLIEAGTELAALIRQIRENDPEAWDAVAADWNAASDEFRNSVDR